MPTRRRRGWYAHGVSSVPPRPVPELVTGTTVTVDGLAPGDDEAPPPEASAIADPAPLPRGATVGRYVVLGMVGEGGMGIVYKAYDPDLERPVALKLLRASRARRAAMSRVRDRMLREAKALARLSDPHVVAVYDVGTVGESVFIATEFVDGETLRAHWAARGAETVSTRLAPLLDAGEGLWAAHRAGLVHRDFKPDNVMVGRDGRVRVLDFGLAREVMDDRSSTTGNLSRSSDGLALSLASASASDRPAAAAPDGTALASADASGLRRAAAEEGARGLLRTPMTRQGAVLGTPRYMAPEQHLGLSVDARTDQFAFSVVVFEALTGRVPFEPTRTFFRQAAEHGHLPPLPEDPRVPPWVRRVLVRGLSLSPLDRYPSLGELLADLRRDPHVRRQRWLAMGAAALAVAVPVAAVAALRSRTEETCRGAEAKLAHVWDAELRRAVGDAFLASGKPYAAAAREAVSRALDEYAGRWVSMHEDACQATRVRGEQSEELLDLRMACLAQRRDELRALVSLFARAEGDVVEAAPRAVQSLPSLEGCADVVALRAPLRPPGDPALRARVDDVRKELAEARALEAAGRFEPGAARALAAARIAERTGYAPVQAEALHLLACLHDDRGDYAAAEETFHRAVVAAERGDHRELLARAFTDLTWVVADRRGRLDEGRRLADLAEAAIEHLQERAPLQGEILRTRARMLSAQGKLAEAFALHRRALGILEAHLGPQAPVLAKHLVDLGNVAAREGKAQEAIGYHRRAVEMSERLLGPEHPDLSYYLKDLGTAYRWAGDLASSRMSLERALRLCEGAFGPEHPDMVFLLTSLGDTAREAGDLPAAHAHYDRALRVAAVAEGTSAVDRAAALAGVGLAYLAERKPHLAIAPLEEAAHALETAAVDPVDRGDVDFALGRALAESGKDHARARHHVEAARALYEGAGARAVAQASAARAWLARAP